MQLWTNKLLSFNVVLIWKTHKVDETKQSYLDSLGLLWRLIEYCVDCGNANWIKQCINVRGDVIHLKIFNRQIWTWQELIWNNTSLWSSGPLHHQCPKGCFFFLKRITRLKLHCHNQSMKSPFSCHPSLLADSQGMPAKYLKLEQQPTKHIQILHQTVPSLEVILC